MDLTPFQRLMVLAVLVAILAPLFAAPLLRLRREMGAWPVALHRVRVAGQIPVVAALGAVLVTEAVLALVYAALGPVALGVWSAPALLPLLGVVLAAGGVAFAAMAERQMGASYRFGIDDRPTDLVRHGLFAVVRNPIYAGILAILGGFAFIAPCPWTVLLWLAAVVGFARQTRLEESNLLAVHGEPYREYAACVGRFLPGIGRLSRVEDVARSR
jgi:protein-S-isoprenylcysteine O-methyltransferase Ste14